MLCRMENSFLQQLVNVLDIIKRVIDKEAQLGDNSQLVSHARTQFVAYGFLVSRDVLYQFFRLLGRKYAQICRADAKVGTDAAARNAHHRAPHASCLRLEYQEYEDEKWKKIVDFYITDDENHIPVRLDMFLKFGSAKAFLVNAKGTRNPITSIVK